MSGKKMGRPSKYNNPETKRMLQELVYQYKRENPTGIIRISHMVRFSKEMAEKYPSKYNEFSKDVWSTYGREYIDNANEPIRQTYESEEDVVIEVPNITDLFEKYGTNNQLYI